MLMQISFSDKKYSVNLNKSFKLGIPVDFSGKQPNFFNAPKATQSIFYDKTCNCEQLTIIPQCNGTHTESIGHISKQNVYINDVLTNTLNIAKLITITPKKNKKTNYYVIDQIDIENNIKSNLHMFLENDIKSLIIRTLPNNQSKKYVTYNENNYPAFFSRSALEYINYLNIQHLLVDLPSIDSMYDNGKLENHKIFWNTQDPKYINKTITEMIYIDGKIQDDIYLLNLQIPAFESESAPSNPIIYPLNLISTINEE